jgi:anti-sigma regulatory factor (Ser/Thr protein kinase)
MGNRRFHEFRRDEAQVRQARRWLYDQLLKVDLPPGGETIERACLLLSEIFTNAVRHGDGGTVRVAFDVDDGGITVETVGRPIRGSAPRIRALPPSAEPLWEGGRGLILVEALSERWGWDPIETGRVRVWFRLLRD